MTARAWEHLDTRFVGTFDQFKVFSDANGWPVCAPCRATSAERARWRDRGGRWFVAPTEFFADDRHGQRDADGDLVRAEVDSSDGWVALYRSPQSDNPECLAMLEPDAADRIGRQLMRLAMAVRAHRAKDGGDHNA